VIESGKNTGKNPVEIDYKVNTPLATEQIVSLFENSGIRRPTRESVRIRRMFDNANLVVSAWHGEQLVGVSRALTDYSYCCYLSDLAVRKEYQRMGIGRTLVQITRERAGRQSMLLLLSAPEAMEYFTRSLTLPKSNTDSYSTGRKRGRLGLVPSSRSSVAERLR
jgi:GNAT superfamily N-acetyltransferase